MEPLRIFHVYNRGLDKRTIFPSGSYNQRFLTSMMLSRLSRSPKPTLYFKQEKLGTLPDFSTIEEAWGPSLVDIPAYCLMPNHFHLLLLEKMENGITKFMSRLADSYTKYYNTRNEREGRLFTAVYKKVKILNDEQMMHVSRYIHRNPTESSFTNIPISELKEYPWSSLNNYLSGKRDLFCQPEFILNILGPSDYWAFVSEGIEDSLEQFPKEIFLDSEVG